MKIKYLRANWHEIKKDLNSFFNPFYFRSYQISNKTFVRSRKIYVYCWFHWGIKPWFVKCDSSVITGKKVYRWQKYIRGREGVCNS